MKVRAEETPGVGRVARGATVVLAIAAVTWVSLAWFTTAPRTPRVNHLAPGFQLCAAGNDDRNDDGDMGDGSYDESGRDDEWTQGAGPMDLWRVQRTWRRAADALRASNVTSVPPPPQAFDPHQRWLRIPGLPSSKLRQAESSTLDIFKLGDTIYAWSGDRWYRSNDATPGYRAADPKELPNDLQSVPARNWHRYPQEWAEKSAGVVLPMGHAGATRSSASS